MNVTDIFHKIEYGPSPESNELATEWLKKNDYTINNFINGEFTKPKNGSYFETLNPATGVAIARVAHSTEEDVNFAVKSAQKSLLDWQNLDCHERAKKIYALARLIQKNSRLLAVLETFVLLDSFVLVSPFLFFQRDIFLLQLMIANQMVRQLLLLSTYLQG